MSVILGGLAMVLSGLGEVFGGLEGCGLGWETGDGSVETLELGRLCSKGRTGPIETKELGS